MTQTTALRTPDLGTPNLGTGLVESRDRVDFPALRRARLERFLAAMEERAIDAYIAAGRAKHPTEGEGGSKRVADMREKIKAGGHKSPYRLRKQLPEPVFGQIKQARGFRQFLMRGLDKVAHEWGLVCLAHNMLKLAQGRSPSAAKPVIA